MIRSFYQASPYITVDDNVLKTSASFLLRMQQEDGSFRDDGRVIHSSMAVSKEMLITTTRVYYTVNNFECKICKYAVVKLMKY